MFLLLMVLVMYFPVCVTSFSWALANNNHYITIRLFYVVYRKRLLKILDLLDEKGIGMDFQVRMKVASFLSLHNFP